MEWLILVAPPHMWSFALNEEIQAHFKTAALSVSVVPGMLSSIRLYVYNAKYDERISNKDIEDATLINPLVQKPIKLASNRSSLYPSKVLYKIIPRNTNPHGNHM